LHLHKLEEYKKKEAEYLKKYATEDQIRENREGKKDITDDDDDDNSKPEAEEQILPSDSS